MSFDLSSSIAIKKVADHLIRHLWATRLESRSAEWTDHNFGRLREFFEDEPGRTCYHKPRNGFSADPREFLWDFLAIQSEGGVVLAAESEQNHAEGRGLKHDFEKLLYVFSPVRLFITKAKTHKEARQIADTLREYAKKCCTRFNPGTIFILHFDLWNDAGSVSYSWQSEGEPSLIRSEEILFEPSS